MENHAEIEFKILKKESQDSVVIEFEQEIISLCNKFHKSGQSGGSAPFVAAAITGALKKLMLFEAISPLTGKDDEWTDITHIFGESQFQNKRDTRVFKDGNGKCEMVSAIVAEDSKGSCWCGSFWKSKEDSLTKNSELKVSSKQEIKSFPFVPKTFHVQVDTIEVAKDDFEMICKNEEQLKEALDYFK